MEFSKVWTAFYTILRKEVVRFLRIWSQTLLPPVITQSLYFLIFGTFIGSQISDINGVSYMAFIVPGLVMMAVINSAFANVSGSFFGSKFQRNIEEWMVSPMPNWAVVAGYAMGGVLRALIVATIVFLVSIFFVRPEVDNIFIVFAFAFLTAMVFSLIGLINAIFANKFDDISIFPTFVLTPLTYLGGVFYSVKALPEFWQTVSLFNPVLYMIDGFRYGFYGIADFNVWISMLVLSLVTVFLVWLALYLLRKGIGLRS